MSRIDRAGHTVMAHFGDFRHLRFVESGVRRNDTDGCVLSRLRILSDAPAGPVRLHNVQKCLPIGSARSGNSLPGPGINDITDTIDCNNRANDDPIGQLDTRCADAALHWLSAIELSDSRAGSGSDAAFLEETRPRIHCSLVAGVRVGTDPAIADIEIKEDSSGDNWNFTAGGCISIAMFFEVTHNTGRGVQAERAAAGENNSVYFLDAI